MANEIKVGIVLDRSDYKKGLKTSEKEAEKSGEKAGEGFTEGFSEKTKKGFASVRSQAIALGATLVATLGGAASIRAAQVQEDAINALNTSLKLAGTFTQQASQEFQEFASSMQQASKFGDEIILQQAALARNFTKTNEEARRLTKAAIELSAATGGRISVDSAVNNLGKSLSGLAGELGESVPGFRNLSVEALKAGAGIQLILDRFGGAAEAELKTFSGATTQAANDIGDLSEAFGEIITKDQVFIDLINDSAKAVRDFSKSIKGIKFSEILNETLNVMIRLIAATTSYFLIFETKAVLAIGKMILLKTQTLLFGVSVRTAIGTAATNSMLLFTGAISKAQVAMTVLRAGVKALKIAASFGLLIALDQVIEKFLMFKDNGQGTLEALGNSFKVLGLNIKLLFQQISIAIIDNLIGSLSKIPIIGEKIANAGKHALASLKDGVAETKAEIDDIVNAPVEGGGLITAPTQSEIEQIRNNIINLRKSLQEEFGQSEDILFLSEKNQRLFSDDLKEKNLKDLAELQTRLKSFADGTRATSKIVNDAVEQNLNKGLTGGFRAMGTALAKGENAFQAFGKSVLSAFGDFLIQIGEGAIAVGLASIAVRTSLADLTGTSALIAGAVLIAAGSAFKALAGGGGGGSSTPATAGGGGVSGGGVSTADSPVTTQQVIPEPQRATNVSLIVQGNVLDRKETASELMAGLQEFVDDQGGKVVFA